METCLNDLLNQSVQLMTPGQQRRFRRRCNLIPGYRDRYVQELADNLLDDPRFVDAAPMATAVMGETGFTGQTRFEIDGSKIRVILDLILEYGPKLLDLILLFVKAFTFALACVACLPLSAAHPKPAETAYPVPQETAQVLPVAHLSRFIESKPKDAGSLNQHILAQWGISGNCPGGVCPIAAPSSSASRSASYQPVEVKRVGEVYQRQWYNHDGLTLRQHAEIMHGHSTAGLTDAQVAALNDHDHNTWGHGGHPSRAAVRVAHGGYAYPVAGRVVRGGAVVVRGAARVVTAPVRIVRNVQPVRRIARGTIRAVNAIRPVNVVRRVRGRVMARRCW